MAAPKMRIVHAVLRISTCCYKGFVFYCCPKEIPSGSFYQTRCRDRPCVVLIPESGTVSDAGPSDSEVLQWLLHLVRPWPPLGHLSLLSKMVSSLCFLCLKFCCLSQALLYCSTIQLCRLLSYSQSPRHYLTGPLCLPPPLAVFSATSPFFLLTTPVSCCTISSYFFLCSSNSAFHSSPKLPYLSLNLGSLFLLSSQLSRHAPYLTFPFPGHLHHIRFGPLIHISDLRLELNLLLPLYPYLPLRLLNRIRPFPSYSPKTKFYLLATPTDKVALFGFCYSFELQLHHAAPTATLLRFYIGSPFYISLRIFLPSHIHHYLRTHSATPRKISHQNQKSLGNVPVHKTN
ncbi:uncharacterized protein ISCGN_002174 [Ixodes scapularis]